MVDNPVPARSHSYAGQQRILNRFPVGVSKPRVPGGWAGFALAAGIYTNNTENP